MAAKTTKVIFDAIDNDNIDTIKYLINCPEMNSVNDKSYTPLMYAVYYGKLEIFQMLIKSKTVDINMRSKSNETALLLAIKAFNHPFSKGNIYFLIIESLILIGADVNFSNINGETALSIAASYNNYEIACLLINSGKNLILGTRALENACYYGNIRIVELLIKANIIVDQNVNVETSYFVSRATHDELVKLLSVAAFKQNRCAPKKCCVCFTQMQQLYALVPCGHVSLCVACIQALSYCPQCKSPIKDHMRIYH